MKAGASTSRRLIELAAKVAGVQGPYVEEKRVLTDCGYQTFTGIMFDREACWNPLTSDADNRALQVKMRLGMRVASSDPAVWSVEDEALNTLALDADPNRAVVIGAIRAAARRST